MRVGHSVMPLGLVLFVGACAVAPPGPTVVGIPGPGKSLAAFQQDDLACRNYAAAQTGYANPAQAATQSAVGSAAVGTALGAAAGALLGAASGHPGVGAAIGAGSGLLLGSAVGANNANASAGSIQGAYNAGYTQCMVSRGDTVERPPAYAAAYPVYPYPYAYPVYPAYPAYGPVYAGPPVW